jgi:3alpha(or 20beta)-hydroxysteroid dehydrogenase
MINLESKISLISGGASGIGAATARAMVGAGAQVMIGDIDDIRGTALAAELGERAAFVHMDVTRAADWQKAVQETVRRFGRLNVLVNNAGMVNAGAIGGYSLQQFEAIIGVNLYGVFLGMSAAVEALKAAAPASIVNVSSVAGLAGMSGLHGYTASKFAVRGLTKSAALELASAGIRVNSVHPGPVRTPMTAGLSEPSGRTPMARFGQPEEIANLICYLASDLSSYSTGSEFVADGGWVTGQRQDELSDVVSARTA